MFLVQAEHSFDFLSAEYAELFSRSHATAFQSPLWLDRLYTRLVPHVGAQPLIVTVRARADGRLVMVLPLLRQRRGAMRVVEFADLRVSTPRRFAMNSPSRASFATRRPARRSARR